MGLVQTEPELRIRAEPPPFFTRRRFLRSFLPPAVIAIGSVIALLASGNLLLPFVSTATVTGQVGTEKVALFQDPEVARILLAHHLAVDVLGTGSRAIATADDLTGRDFVLPSGRPAAVMIENRELRTNADYQVYRPFVSPLVLATYRPYADALVDAGIATPQDTAPGQPPLYYNLDLDRFVTLVRGGGTWSALHVAGAPSGGPVIPDMSSVCGSNSADSFLALVAFATNHDALVTDPGQASTVATAIRPLFAGRGLTGGATSDRFGLYLSPDGSAHAPIVVAYEHQYLAYQIDQTRKGRPDRTRVLLYPNWGVLTQPEFMAFTPSAAKLGQVLVTDPDLQQREVELGYRVVAPSQPSSAQLFGYLRQIGMPAPVGDGTSTGTTLPDPVLLDQMVNIVGGCGS